jgi:hypothetical protein
MKSLLGVKILSASVERLSACCGVCIGVARSTCGGVFVFACCERVSVGDVFWRIGLTSVALGAVGVFAIGAVCVCLSVVCVCSIKLMLWCGALLCVSEPTGQLG